MFDPRALVECSLDDEVDWELWSLPVAAAVTPHWHLFPTTLSLHIFSRFFIDCWLLHLQCRKSRIQSYATICSLAGLPDLVFPGLPPTIAKWLATRALLLLTMSFWFCMALTLTPSGYDLYLRNPVGMSHVFCFFIIYARVTNRWGQTPFASNPVNEWAERNIVAACNKTVKVWILFLPTK